ncbi:MAG: hypothetical protein QM489_04860 [Candidatus Izemoplasma sp.]
MKNYNYIIFGGILIISYLVVLNWVEIDVLSTVFVTLGTIIGGIAIWIQLKRDKDLKEAEFLIMYNNTFLEIESFTRVEQVLESYLNGKSKKKDIEDLERQELINYLVYLEALATLIIKGVLNFKAIDNLFSYRFFLAVNNKVVQDLELVPDAEYYKGVYILHKKWTKYKLANNLKILALKTSLERVNDYNLYSK